MPPIINQKHEFLIIGGGMVGLSLAHQLIEKGISKSILITLLYCTQITYAIIESNLLTESQLIHKVDSKKIPLNQNSPLMTIM